MANGVRKALSMALICFSTFTTLFISSNAASSDTYSGYIMGFFNDGTNQYGLNLCYGTDGLHWSDLNKGNPVYVPTLGQKGLRDPYVFRKQDGAFAVVATDMRGQTWSDHSQHIHYFDSTDLCTFKNERLLKVHNTDMHSWSPEVFYDAKNSRYGIYWSGNTDYNRTYINYTTDFNTVTSNQIFFDPGFDVIDSDVISNGSTNYLFFKDERSTGKRIKAAKSTSFDPKSFTVFTSNFLTSANTEGPITFKDNTSNTWYMYADLFSQGGVFECWKTTDLNATSWTKVTDFSVPSGVRHGSIVPVTAFELYNIKAKWSENFVPLDGDLNIDGKVNSNDISILKRVILGTYTESYLNADMNKDGKINSADYSLLKRKILRLS